jgi:phosphatidylglycerophosphate synthase
MAHQIGAAAIPVQRIQRNLLAASERKLLNWLCARMPRWVTPDRLTATGVAGAVATFVGYAASGAAAAWLWLAIVGFAIQWFGDSMDGSLARYRRIERPAFGYFIDHSCDGFTVFVILAGMGLSPYVRLDVAPIALVGYLLLCVHAFLATKVIGEMKLSYLAAGPTELRLMLIGLTAAMLVLGPSGGAFGRVSGFDLFVGGVGTLYCPLREPNADHRAIAGKAGYQEFSELRVPVSAVRGCILPISHKHA